MPTLNLVPASSDDYRRIAEKRLPRFLFDYVDGGAFSEDTMSANIKDFDKFTLKQQVMRDVSQLDTSHDLFGETAAMPLALAPIGMAGMMARRGELQAKKAADKFGIPFCLSTVGICSLEEVASVSDKPFWFQLYMLKDRGAVTDMLARAKAVGVTTLVFTVDLAVVGARYRDVRNGMSGGTNAFGRLRAGLFSYLSHPKWLLDVGITGKPHVFGNLTQYVPMASTPTDFKDWIDDQFDPAVTWKDIEWLRSHWHGNLIIKGILSAEDARFAAKTGADAIIVSNHGGRQLDSVSSSVAMLPRIIDAVGDQIDVLVDGGIRSGLDVTKIVALGAKAALIGRPWVYAMAAKGEAGVHALLTTLQKEMEVAMALTGVTTTHAITKSVLDDGK